MENSEEVAAWSTRMMMRLKAIPCALSKAVRSVPYSRKRWSKTYDNLHNHVRHTVLRVVLRERGAEEDDNSDGVHQPRVDDDTDDMFQTVRVDGAVDRLPSYAPDLPHDECW